MAIPTLPNISRSKGNLTTKLDNLIEYNMINYFFEKSYTKCDGKATPRPFYKVKKFSISLDHQSEIFWSLFFLYVQVVIYQLITIIITILITMKILRYWLHDPGFADMKFQPVQPGQISPYDYIGESSFLQARRDSFPRGICINVFTFSFKIPFHPTYEVWSDYMENFSSGKAESRQCNKWISLYVDETFHMYRRI